ncbi:MAG: ribbon-helix-helix domain-containing protein [Thermoplasmata archaeon]|nr:ribbon-helix-helix domain-containing protein [Thermoplasmata archaeon]
MERRDRSTIVSIRIPDGLLEKIEADVEGSGDFTSRADYILAAIRHFEEYRIRILAERKAAYGDVDYEAPSGSVQLRNNEVKG